MNASKAYKNAPMLDDPSLCGDWFCWGGDVHIVGNVEMDRSLIVIGDLRIGGDLTANEVICMGDLFVDGRVQVDDMLVGGTVFSAQSIDAKTLRAGFKPYYVARIIERMTCMGNDHDSFAGIKEQVRSAYEPNPNFSHISGIVSLRVGKQLRCKRLETGGGVELDGSLEAERVFIDGHLSAEDIFVKEKLAVDSWIDYRGTLQAPELPDRPIYCNGALVSAPNWYHPCSVTSEI